MQKPARSKGAEHTYFVRVSALSLCCKIYADLLNENQKAVIYLRNINFIKILLHRHFVARYLMANSRITMNKFVCFNRRSENG